MPIVIDGQLQGMEPLWKQRSSTARLLYGAATWLVEGMLVQGTTYVGPRALRRRTLRHIRGVPTYAYVNLNQDLIWNLE